MEVNSYAQNLDNLLKKNEFNDDWNPRMQPPPVKQIRDSKIEYDKDLIKSLYQNDKAKTV